MINYIVNFGVYTMAMIGIIAAALFIYKKSVNLNIGQKSNLKIDDKIALNARKSLYVVNAGGEKFLIAGDVDNTSLIAKLGQNDDATTNAFSTPIKLDRTINENLSQMERKPFVSNESETIKLSNFKAELSELQKVADDEPKNTAPIRFEKYLDIKKIRQKPVMKELARKLAEI